MVVALNGLGVGDSNFKSFIFFAVPLILCFYGGCVWVVLREEPGTAIERLKSLFCWEFTHKNVEDEQSILMRELQLAWRPACYQGIVGTLQVFNHTLCCFYSRIETLSRDSTLRQHLVLYVYLREFFCLNDMVLTC